MTDKFVTRRPTGKPPWPILLIAGAEKSGKSYAAAQASASALIGRTFWIGVGEDDPDEYGNIPGARFEIVQHDGSYRGILAATDAACAQPSDANKPNMIVLDSATRLWWLLIDNAQAVANTRAAVKTERANKPVPAEDAQITMDLWNKAKTQWRNVVILLQSHNGPSIITSRFAETLIVEKGRPQVGRDGQPTGNKEWKVKAEQSLPYDVSVVVEMPRRGTAYLTKVRSLAVMTAPDERKEYNDFTVEQLWRDLGVIDGTTQRQHSATLVTNPNAALLAEIGGLADTLGIDRRKVAADWAEDHDGEPIGQATNVEALEKLRDHMKVEVQVAEQLRNATQAGAA